MIGVEREAVTDRGDAGLQNIEPELIEHGRRAREPVAPMRRIDHDRRRAALAVRLDGHQGLIAVSLTRRQGTRVPGDLLGRVAQEVDGRQARPGALDRLRLHTRAAQQRTGGVLMLAHEFVLIDRRLQPAAQGALDTVVELLEQ